MSKTFSYSLEINRPGVSIHTLYFASFTDREKRIKKLIKEHFVGRLEPYYWDEEDGTWHYDVETAMSLWVKPEVDRSAMLEDLSSQCLVLAQQKEDLSQAQLQELQQSFQVFFSLLEKREESADSSDSQEYECYHCHDQGCYQCQDSRELQQ